MTHAAILSSADWALRGGTCALVLLIAGTLLRDHGRLVSARLGALFALGTAAYTLCSAAGFQLHMEWWAVPLIALSTGNNVVFWSFTSSLFDDGFRLRWWHMGLWLLFVALGILDCLVSGPQPSVVAKALGIGLTLSSLGFAALAIAQVVSTWRVDLVEGRRRLRLFIVVASSVYIGLTTLLQLIGTSRAAPGPVSLVSACGLLAIVGVIAWALLRVSSSQSLFVAPAMTDSARLQPIAEPRAEPVDQGLVDALERLMAVDRIYRQDGLTIGALAQKLDLPEYRLRRLINQALGYRNFNSFLNRYRIAEARAALTDPSQAAVPVLTIALDTGFNSLGPFNRAFKAETGRTPSEYRRQTTPDSGIGQPIPVSASAVSNSARGIPTGP